MSFRTRLARLERAAGPDGRPGCPDCVQIRILDWRHGEPEPAPRCPHCGRAVPCIIVVEPAPAPGNLEGEAFS
jgi:hypothetical protein